MIDRPGRFLVVDDHPTNRLKLAMAVRALGHGAEQAENGAVALRMMREQAFDLVLLDLVMPEMSGHEVLETMRRDPDLRMLPVIVVSAGNEMADAIACIERGAEDYLQKPFDPVLLKARIGASLAKKRLNDAVRQQMNFIRGIFGKFVPDAVVTEIIESGGELKPTRTLATVVMTDIVGFSAIAERLSPEQTLDMLNDYFRAILAPITRHGGIVNAFEGDGAMALFNVPLEDPDHADKAVSAALEIVDLTERETFAGHRLATRIGINTGEVVAGNVGDGSRLTYTVLGDTVNTASRLERLNEELDSRIVVSDATMAALRTRVPFRDGGTATLRGKTETIGIKVLA